MLLNSLLLYDILLFNIEVKLIKIKCLIPLITSQGV